MFKGLMPVTRALLLTCIAVFLLQQVAAEPLLVYGALWPLNGGPDFPPFQPWQLVSYAFLHGGFPHLAFNMLGLYMFGSEIERLLGTRRFLTYYFVCVVGAAVAQLAVTFLGAGGAGPTVGASGGIMGVLLAFALAYPQRKIIFLLLPIPMPAWLFVTLYGLAELFLGVTGTLSGVAHFAHLGGMAAGFLLITYWRARRT